MMYSEITWNFNMEIEVSDRYLDNSFFFDNIRSLKEMWDYCLCGKVQVYVYYFWINSFRNLHHGKISNFLLYSIKNWTHWTKPYSKTWPHSQTKHDLYNFSQELIISLYFFFQLPLSLYLFNLTITWLIFIKMSLYW